MSQLNSFFVNNFVVPVYDIVRGTSRFKYGKFLEKSQWLSPNQIKEMQNQSLRSLIKHSYETVPYYKRVFRERGLKPGDIRTQEDLVKLPILNKEDIRNNFDDLISRSFEKDQLVPYQSGGTGSPIKFYITKDKISWEVAAEYRFYGWGGYKLGDRCFLVWASPADLKKYEEMVNRFTMLLEQKIMVDAYVLSDEILNGFARQLEKFNPEIIRGYATPVYMLAKYLLENNIKFVHPRAVFTHAETLLPSRRKVIEEAFDCRVFDYYGSREIGGIASECEEHDGYHICAENLVAEFLEKGEQVASGERGVITLTSLRNFGMPFIRYNTADVGRPSDEICSCGRGLPLMSSLEGRVSGFMSVYDKKSGRIVPVMPAGPGLVGVALMHVPLENYRVIQESLERIVIKAVKGKGYSQKHTDFLVDYVQKFLGTEVMIDVEFVDYIPPLPSGKRTYFISKVNAFEN